MVKSQYHIGNITILLPIWYFRRISVFCFLYYNIHNLYEGVKAIKNQEVKPNIVLIVTDQMRSDCLGAAGNPVIETPYLDTLAVQGAMFNNAYTAVPSCIAARAALMTGLSQKSHGRLGYQDRVTWDYRHYLAGELALAGYHTHCVGKMHVHPSRSLCGFHDIQLHDGYLHNYRSMGVAAGENQFICDDYINWLREHKGANADIIDTGPECNSRVARPWIYEEHLHPTNWVVTRSIDFLRRKDPSKPFFLTMSFVRPHSPIDPPKYYFDMYQNEDVPMPLMGDWADRDDFERDGMLYNCMRGIARDKDIKKARAAYYGCITHIDHQIGRFLQALFDHDAQENTVIIFTSDHGDLLGDHNLYRKSLPYRGSASIPLIISDRGDITGMKKNASIIQVVELRDIMPTILDIADAAVPDAVEGKSMLPLLKGEQCAWREYIHGEHALGNMSNHYIACEKDKYIWFPVTGLEQYFNLEKDPDELKNLIGDENCQSRIEYLKNALTQEL